MSGILAQLGEHLPYKQRVTGSSPVGPIFYAIDNVIAGCGSVWLEYLVWDQGVAGSNPVTPIAVRQQIRVCSSAG